MYISSNKLNPDPELLINLAMVKSAMQGMRAVEEFATESGFQKPDGWVVTGISKRGWTAWDAGAVQCEKCVKVKAVAPLVPVAPDIPEEIHRMWQAYNGFTWALHSYILVNFTERVDTALWHKADQIIDPIGYLDRFKKVPIYVHVASDDQFMMFDWSNIWYDKFTGGEKHFMIMPNDDHGIGRQMDMALSNIGNLVRSLSVGAEYRPNIPFTYNSDDGSITIKFTDPAF